MALLQRVVWNRVVGEIGVLPAAVQTSWVSRNCGLKRQLWTAIMELERTTDMRYVTSVERIGREEGRKEGEAVLLRRLLLHRFGAIPAWAEARLKGATTEQFEAWGERILDATTLEDVFETQG